MIYEHFSDLPNLLSQKLITKRKHPTEDLWIYNYSPAAQSLGIDKWSPALCDCRGLILDEAGEVVGRPFSKFWNYEQVEKQIPYHLPHTVWEKLDGSLGILFRWKGILHVATRGSFESEQARWAENFLKNHLTIEYGRRWIPPEGHTFLVEIIFPENRIVVDYGPRQDLILLAVMHNDGVEDLATFYASNLPKARRLPPDTVSFAIQPMSRPNEEGYVLRWANGFRAKVKFAEYVRLHRLITQVSTRSIWELLRTGKSLTDLIERVPNDFRDWVVQQSVLLSCKHRDILQWVDFAFRTRPCEGRKEFALWASKQDYPSLLFAKLDKKPIDDLIWRMIEPKWSTPFRREKE